MMFVQAHRFLWSRMCSHFYVSSLAANWNSFRKKCTLIQDEREGRTRTEVAALAPPPQAQAYINTFTLRAQSHTHTHMRTHAHAEET